MALIFGALLTPESEERVLPEPEFEKFPFPDAELELDPPEADFE
jgi:hypothetical protein